MPQPILTTHRMILRPANEQDIDFLHGLWDHLQIRQYLFDDEPVPRDLAQSVLDDCLVRSSDGLGLWIMQARDAADLLGCAGLNPTSVASQFDPALEGLLEPVVALHPSHWHQGLAAEALSALLKYAFHQLELAEIVAVNDEPNLASQRMLLRLGFEPMRMVPGPCHALQTYKLSASSFERYDDV